jgi:endonuclease/exonuclease/phosphatase family metal-dependent hydrolase
MRRFAAHTFAALALLVSLAPAALGQERVIRVAAYNIQFLNTSISAARRANLREVVQHLDADVIGLQEIADRAALQAIFPPSEWQIVIDDDSSDTQDVAVVVRRPLEVVMPGGLDADDGNFLFPNPADNSFFPNRRDVLFVEVRVPDSGDTFFVMVNHLKARSEGRNTTEPRRVGAARDLVRVLRDRFDDRDFVLLGDMNDNPDDRSMNILETGDFNAQGGPEEADGPFMINLMDRLVAAGHVSHGRDSGDIVSGRINTIDPESRDRNNEARGTDLHTGDILFDQILIPVEMGNRYVGGSAEVFDHEAALRGSGSARASDHLPVFAEFLFGSEDPEPPAPQVRIVSLLPNPAGTDAGREQVTIGNTGASAVDLTGWRLEDDSGHRFALSGTVAANSSRTITMTANTMPLTNSGDEVRLIDPAGAVRHRVSYTGAQAGSGQVVVFP